MDTKWAKTHCEYPVEKKSSINLVGSASEAHASNNSRGASEHNISDCSRANCMYLLSDSGCIGNLVQTDPLFYI